MAMPAPPGNPPLLSSIRGKPTPLCLAGRSFAVSQFKRPFQNTSSESASQADFMPPAFDRAAFQTKEEKGASSAYGEDADQRGDRFAEGTRVEQPEKIAAAPGRRDLSLGLEGRGRPRAILSAARRGASILENAHRELDLNRFQSFRLSLSIKCAAVSSHSGGRCFQDSPTFLRPLGVPR